MHKVILGEDGIGYSWQNEFPINTKCCQCNGEARIAFVYFEDFDHEKKVDEQSFVCDLHENEGKGGYWLHDCCSVAIYFCRDCLNPTALYNQG